MLLCIPQLYPSPWVAKGGGSRVPDGLQRGVKIHGKRCPSSAKSETKIQEFGPMLSWMKHIFRNLVPFFMGEKSFQEFGPNFSWLKHVFRNLVPRFMTCPPASGYMGEKYFQEFGPIFFDMS